MKYTCLHTHTHFCDGTGSVEDFCRAAYTKGLVSLGFSAHAPLLPSLGIASDWHLPMANLVAYLDEVHRAKERWLGRLDVYLGLEVDFLRGYMSPADAFYQGLGLDYIIGSVHCVLPEGAAPDWPRRLTGTPKLLCIDGTREDMALLIKEGFSGNVHALIEAYYSDIRAMVFAGGFDIVGHLDLIIKNNADGFFFSQNDAAYLEHSSRAVQAIAQAQLVVEVNTGGLNRGRTKEPYPAPALLRQLRQLKVPLVINADAHKPEHIGGYYETARLAMIDAGYTSHTLFNGRKSTTPLWIIMPLV